LTGLYVKIKEKKRMGGGFKIELTKLGAVIKVTMIPYS
jgi:hypothetical protein